MGYSFEEITSRILGAAVEVHKALGPGFVESIYQRAMEVALEHRGIPFQRQKEVHVYFEDTDLGVQRLDLVVQEQVILELKAARALEEIHFCSAAVVSEGYGPAYRPSAELQRPHACDQTCCPLNSLAAFSCFRPFVFS